MFPLSGNSSLVTFQDAGCVMHSGICSDHLLHASLNTQGSVLAAFETGHEQLCSFEAENLNKHEARNHS
jgi:hypothetical protein